METRIWDIDVEKKGKVLRFFIQILKIVLLAYKGFLDDKVRMRASALTFFSLLSIVPVLAMAFGIAKGFGLDRELETQLAENFSGREEVLTTGLEFARNLLDNTKGGLIAGIGTVLLVYSVMELLNHIEKSFNDIWYIKQERPLVRKFTDYLTIILIAPVLMVVSNSLTVFVTNTIQDLTQTVRLIGLFKGVIFPLLRLAPYFVIWLLFTLLYLIMPNTKVKVPAAITAGVLAGTAFLLTEWVLIRFQINVSEFNAIYGSFAVLPLFLGWLQISWLIVLFGGEIAYATQNIKKFEYEREKVDYSDHNKKMCSLLVMHVIVKEFVDGQGPASFSSINQKLKIPSRYLHKIIGNLTAARLVSEVITDEDESHYQPAQDASRLTPSYVIEQLDNSGNNEPVFEESELSASFIDILSNFRTQVDQSSQNKLLKEI